MLCSPRYLPGYPNLFKILVVKTKWFGPKGIAQKRNKQRLLESAPSTSKTNAITMNVEQYIESGILEAYALGACSPAEQQEVAQMIAAHPELKAALDALYADLEKLAQVGAVQPSPALRGRVMAAIAQEAAAASPPAPPPTKAASPSRLGYLLAALAFAAGVLGIWLLQGKVEDLRLQVEADKQSIAACEARTEQLRNTERQLAFMGAKDTNPIRLAALPGQDENLMAFVYHNGTQNATLLNVGILPPAPSGKSWQLWAIVDGTPQSMGVVAASSTTGTGLLEVPFMPTAQAFAISLEPLGGSQAPTEVVMLGKV